MRVVYIDTLFVLNIMVDYFLLRLTAAIGGVYPKPYRLMVGAVVGAVWAVILYFCDLPPMLAMLFRGIICCLTVFAAFGRQAWYPWLRLCSLFMILTVLSAGAVFCLAFQNDNLSVQNGVPYINISITVMVISFTMIYLLSKLVFGKGRGHIVRRFREISVVKAERNISFRALEDSGNLLQDPVSGKRVLIVQTVTAAGLFTGVGRVLLENLPKEVNETDLEQLRRCCKTAFWLLPVHTALQNGMILVFRPDQLLVDGKTSTEYVIGLSPELMDIGGDCRAVIGV